MTGSAEEFEAQWRLARVEVVNWGTFHGHVAIDIARRGHLFTGPSGSGKSSLFDAIATVLTPAAKLRYNAAAQEAGGRGDDRSLVSYIRGAWSRRPGNEFDRAVNEYLRTGATWSGILLRFRRSGETVSLARLFHLRSGSNERSDVRDLAFIDRNPIDLLELGEHVRSGIDARSIKRAWPDAIVSTSSGHRTYFNRLVRLLGIDAVETLHLLHRTQSAKNLGSLDRLFRDFMLDVPSTFVTARQAIEQFGDLRDAHRLVRRARDQVERLQALEPAIEQFESSERAAERLARVLDGFEAFQLTVSERLARDELVEIGRESGIARIDLDEAERLVVAAEQALDDARRRSMDSGGDEAGRARERVEAANQVASVVESTKRRFIVQLGHAGISAVPGDAAAFATFLDTAGRELASASEAADLHGSDEHQAYATTRNERDRLRREREAIARRRSNLPAQLLDVRARLARELGIAEPSLPFVGELLSVRPAHREWQGAIERVLRPFATSLLVTTDRIRDVRRLIEDTHLGTRLVVEEVANRSEPIRSIRSSRSLVHRVDVAEGRFAAWLHGRLATRFDMECVDSPDELDAVDRGVTIHGQLKRAPGRFEKDDRHRIDDRERWVLGADNSAKLAELDTRLAAAEVALDRLDRRLRAVQEQQRKVEHRRGVLHGLVELTWSEIDVTTARTEVAFREAELHAALADNHDLRVALEAESAARTDRDDANDRRATAHARVTGLAADAERIGREIAESAEFRRGLDAPDPETTGDLEARFRAVRRNVDRTTLSTVATRVQSDVGKELDRERQSMASARTAYERGATTFIETYPEVAGSLVNGIEGRHDLRELRVRIESRGLPEFEARFRTLWREKSREAVGLLLSELRDAPKEVRDRIDPVNASLRLSPFDHDRTLHIRVREQRSPEVNAFIAELRSVVDDSWADEPDEVASEARYATLDRLMQRLASSAREDEAWRARCLDTREHVVFQAQERDTEGDVVNVHDSSAGLSGGQRQKLVIFCLAAALRYQFTNDESERPAYGTVVLDEAFDKADSAFTRMAMDVFSEFGFHMILATPEKLLTTLEPYVGAITHISNPTRRHSAVAQLDWENAPPESWETGMPEGSEADPAFDRVRAE